MNDCIFCKIINGEIPSYKVYEDDNFLAFLDIRPLSKGNTLIIPKQHYQWVYDVPNFGEYWEVAKKIAKACISVFNADSVSFLTLGYEIPHSHIRLIPRFQDDVHKGGIVMDYVQNYTPEQMQEIAAQIRNYLQQ